MWVVWSVAHAACPSTAAAIAEHVERAETAFGALDAATFEAARVELHADLGCLTQPISPNLAARAHGVDALGGVLAKDDPAIVASLRAARGSDATWRLPPGVPPGHRLHAMLADVPADPPQTAPVGAPEGTRAQVDGRPADLRPTDRPTIVVLQEEASGKVVWSGLLARAEG